MPETIKTEKKAGYEIRTIRYAEGEVGNGPAFEMVCAFALDGGYIGDVFDAEYLVGERGILPQKRTPESNSASVGFCEREGKWYGWSHRAMCGFGIGNKLFESGWPKATDQTPFLDHGDKTIETLDEAKLAAERFAESVS